ncbi:hypothetical protein SDC9_207566 [bioreactor metagenome]|uniref:Uncharacterized protein n=1 Tax=bioreactor metagenome TaxID=1076179 RepID=A0A645JHM5_9ZZZZ
MEVAIFVAHVEEAAQTADACIVDQNVDAAFHLFRFLQRRRHGGGIGHIRNHRRTAMPAATEFIRQLFNLIGDIQQD